MDEFGVRRSTDVDQRLADKGAVHRLLHLIEDEADRNDRDELEGTGQLDAVLASRRIDLSGYVECAHFDCARPRIERIYPRLWHYFDQIVVEGIPIGYVEILRQEGLTDEIVSRVEQEIRALLYFRQAGAEPFLNFVHKPTFCADHFNGQANSAGVYSFVSEADKKRVIKHILNNSDITIEPKGADSWWVSASSSLFEEPYQYGVAGGGKPDKREVADFILEKYSNALVTGVTAARSFKLPLAETINAAWLAKEQPPAHANYVDVVLDLELPVLSGLGLKDFLKLREDERDSFELYRSALREAIDKQLSRRQGEPPAQIAQAVVTDFIRPGLAGIGVKSRTSRRAMIKKSALNIAVGSTAVAVGSLDALPLITTAGVAAIAASVAFMNKKIDDKSEISTSNCYFLWKAQKLAGKAK
jgi:hypothetical protein